VFDYEIDIAGLVNGIFDTIVELYGNLFRDISDVIECIFELAIDFLLVPPEFILIIAIGLVLWKVANLRIASFGVASLIFISMMGLWNQAVDTMVLVLFATTFSLALAIPVGIIMGISDKLSSLFRPILDLMQTMPAFVYLIPAVMFFGVGKVPAIFATVVFAVPPPIRLTELGIRQVDPEAVEAGRAFGSTPWQLLMKIQLPLAVPTIAAGINQCVMLSLSMAVISSMIGAGGLGGEVLYGINRLDVGHGFEAGISIVLLAIMLDRMAANIKKEA